MENRYTKIVLTVVAVFPLLAIETQSASAVDCSAKRCTQAYNNCTTVGCRREGGGASCRLVCKEQLERCLQTGEWVGRGCQLKGLIKQ